MPSAESKEINKAIDTLRVFEAQLATLARQGEPPESNATWHCRCKMASTCAQIANRYSHVGEADVPAALLARAEDVLDSGDQRSYRQDSQAAREQVFEALENLHGRSGDNLKALHYRTRKLLVQSEVTLRGQHPAVPVAKAFIRLATQQRWSEALADGQRFLIALQEPSVGTEDGEEDSERPAAQIAAVTIAHIQIGWALSALDREDEMQRHLASARGLALQVGEHDRTLAALCEEFDEPQQQQQTYSEAQQQTYSSEASLHAASPEKSTVRPKTGHASAQRNRAAGNSLHPSMHQEAARATSASSVRAGGSQCLFDRKWGSSPSLNPALSSTQKRRVRPSSVGPSSVGSSSLAAHFGRGCDIATALLNAPSPVCSKPVRQRPKSVPPTVKGEAPRAKRGNPEGRAWLRAAQVATAQARAEARSQTSKKGMWAAIADQEHWVPMGSRCALGRKNLAGSQLVYSQRMLEHHKPSFMKQICRMTLKTVFSQQELIEVLVKMSKLSGVNVGDMVTNAYARVPKRHFRNIAVEQQICNGRLHAIDRLFFAFSSEYAPNGSNTVSFSDWMQGFSALLLAREKDFKDDKKPPTDEQLRLYFRVYDYNEDNSISRMDLFEGLNQNNQSQPYAVRSSPQRIIAAINRLFQLLDTDGSGELLFEDFRQLVSNPELTLMFWELFEMRDLHPPKKSAQKVKAVERDSAEAIASNVIDGLQRTLELGSDNQSDKPEKSAKISKQNR